MDIISLGLNQLQAAKYEYLSEHVCDWSENPRPFSTLAVMQSGGGRFVTPDETVEIESGTTFFIPAGSKYISYWHGTEEIMYYAIHFNFDNLYSEFSPQRFCLQKVDNLLCEEFVKKFEKVLRYVSCSGFEMLKAFGAFYDLYADVLPLLKQVNYQTAPESIKDAIDYIEQNSEKEFTVKFLAEMCHLSESRLYALFQKSLGCSPIAYRNSVRIRKAMLLLGGNYPIDEVASMVGFSSAIYFRRVFREIMGKLPSQYRKILKFSIATNGCIYYTDK